MRRIRALALVLAVSTPAVEPLRAEDTTASLLRAPRVKNTLAIAPRSDGLVYTVDGRGEGVTFVEGQTFAVDDEAVVVFPGFNPLKWRVQADAADADDPNFKQLAEFLDKVPDLKKAIDGLAENKVKAQALERAAGAAAVPCAYDAFEAKLREASRQILYPGPVAEPADVSKWVEAATGQAGVAKVAAEMKTAAGTAETQAKNAREALKTLEDEIRVVVKGAKHDSNGKTTYPDETKCSGFRASTLSALAALANESDRFFTERANFHATLLQLSELLSAFAAKEWTKDGTGYVFLRKRPTSAKLANVTVEVKTVTLSRSDDLMVIETLKPKSKATFTLRSYQSIVPEVSAAIVYTGFTKPKYGTAPSPSDPAKTVVVSAGSDDIDLSAAVLLNGVFNTGRHSFAYPMLQLGLSVSEAAPAILLGGGFRFTNPKRFGIAGGAVLGWIKDLKRLHPGDPVSGTADIEADLERDAKVSYYVTLQYQF